METKPIFFILKYITFEAIWRRISVNCKMLNCVPFTLTLEEAGMFF